MVDILVYQEEFVCGTMIIDALLGLVVHPRNELYYIDDVPVVRICPFQP